MRGTINKPCMAAKRHFLSKQIVLCESSEPVAAYSHQPANGRGLIDVVAVRRMGGVATSAAGRRRQVGTSASRLHSCGVTSANSGYCCGNNGSSKIASRLLGGGGTQFISMPRFIEIGSMCQAMRQNRRKLSSRTVASPAALLVMLMVDTATAGHTCATGNTAMCPSPSLPPVINWTSSSTDV